jgi:ankyrin repeat protein
MESKQAYFDAVWNDNVAGVRELLRVSPELAQARWPGRGRPDGLMRSLGPSPFNQHSWLPSPINLDDLDDPRFTSTPLHWTRNDAMVKALVENGADVNARGTGGDLELPDWLLTPLWRAAHDGRMESVRLLVASGAEVNVLNPDGCNQALKAAIENGHAEVAAYLLANGARPDIITAAMLGLRQEVAGLLTIDPTRAAHRDEHGRTPLDAALLMDDFRATWPQTAANDQVVEVLLEYGAEADLAHMASLGWADKLRQMLKDEPRTATQRRAVAPLLTGATTFESPLEAARRRGRAEIVRLLSGSPL